MWGCLQAVRRPEFKVVAIIHFTFKIAYQLAVLHITTPVNLLFLAASR